MKNNFIFLLLLISVSFAGCDKTEAPATEGAAQQQEFIQKKYEPITIDTNTELITSDANIDHVKSLIARIFNTFPKKDEFETNDQYRNKFNNSEFHKEYCFWCYATVGSYDVSNKIITISLYKNNDNQNAILPEKISFVSGNMIGDFRIQHFPRPKSGFFINQTLSGEYNDYYNYKDGSNHTEKSCIVNNYSLIELSPTKKIDSIINNGISFSISAENGRELKNNLGVLVLAIPEVKKEQDGDATIWRKYIAKQMTVSKNKLEIMGGAEDVDPNVYIYNNFLYSTIKAILIYNRSTGHIYHKELII